MDDGARGGVDMKKWGEEYAVAVQTKFRLSDGNGGCASSYSNSVAAASGTFGSVDQESWGGERGNSQVVDGEDDGDGECTKSTVVGVVL